MTTRSVRFKDSAAIEPCPACGNRTVFAIHSEQASEDCCEVWAQCTCGFEHSSQDRLEDVWGGVDDNNVRAAISVWNDAVRAAKGTA